MLEKVSECDHFSLKTNELILFIDCKRNWYSKPLQLTYSLPTYCLFLRDILGLSVILRMKLRPEVYLYIVKIAKCVLHGLYTLCSFLF